MSDDTRPGNGDLWRKLALAVLRREGAWETEAAAVAALGGGPNPDAWQPFGDVEGVQDGRWFYWRDPDEPTDMHTDRAIADADGRIEGKYGCGLTWYRECQPCALDQEALAALAEGRA